MAGDSGDFRPPLAGRGASHKFAVVVRLAFMRQRPQGVGVHQGVGGRGHRANRAWYWAKQAAVNCFTAGVSSAAASASASATGVTM